MAKNPIKQIQVPVPGTTPTTYDIQDNTLVQGTNITITEETDGTRKINADVPIKAITTAPGEHINTPGTPTVTASTSGTTTTLTFDYLKGAKGDKGNTGDTGPAGANGVSMRNKGNWASGTAYVNNSSYIDVVYYATNGCSYMCKKDHTSSSSILPTDTTYWTLVASKGANGTNGTNGQDGDDGVGIASITKTSTTGLVDTYTIEYTDTNTSTFTVTNGANGTSAGFGTPTATIDANTGTPTVTVSASGPDTAKVFAFEFKNLKGTKGDTGSQGPAGQDGLTTKISVNGATYTQDSGTITLPNYPEGITEISGQEVNIWNLDPGVYKLTYNGRKIIYYKGVSSVSGILVGGTSGGDLLLYVSAYKTAPYKKIWHLCELKDTNNDVLLHYGWVSEGDGSYETINAFKVPPKSHAATTNVYGLGTTLSYGHLKTQTGDLNGTTSTDGVAAGLGHTHSQYLTSHQSIKSLNTNNSTAQTASSSEDIAGSGTINLHKVSKTGSYSDLLDKPDATDIDYDTGPTQFSGDTVADALNSIDSILDEKGSGTVTSVAISNDTNGGLTVSSGSPITSSGTIKLKHSNVLAASGTIGSSSASSGASLSVPYANYDINGHITSTGTHTHTINNLTSSAINSSYKLPTTTEWSNNIVSANPATTTNTLTTLQIGTVNYALGTSVGVAYNMGTCTTAASTQAKTVNVGGTFSLTTGVSCIVYFTNANTNTSATLSVNSTTAKSIRLNGSALSSSNKMLSAIYFCRYDGTNWQLYYMQGVSYPYHHHAKYTEGNWNLTFDWWSNASTPITSASILFNEIQSAIESNRVVYGGYYAYSSTNKCPIVYMYAYMGGEVSDEPTIDVYYTRSTTTTLNSFTLFSGSVSDTIIN